MDDDLELVKRLQGHAIGAVNELEDDLIDAIRTITRLHAENARLVKERDEALAAVARRNAEDGEALDVWESHPCRLCDPDGKCGGACEYADSVAPPTLRQCFGALQTAEAQRDAERDEHMAARSELFTRALKAEAQRDAAREAWDWLQTRMNLSLEYDWPDEEEPGEWQVHRVSGGYNDREWELVGVGETPMEAVQAASRTLGGVGG